MGEVPSDLQGRLDKIPDTSEKSGPTAAIPDGAVVADHLLAAAEVGAKAVWIASQVSSGAMPAAVESALTLATGARLGAA